MAAALLLLVVGLSLIALLALAVMRGPSREPRLTRPERRELKLRRREHEQLMQLCLDNMDVEPYARIVYNTLTNTQKELGS